MTTVLFRTVADFPDQDMGRQIALAVLDALFEAKEKGEAESGTPGISRRDLFTRLGAA